MRCARIINICRSAALAAVTALAASSQTTIAFFDGVKASNSASIITGVDVSAIGVPGGTSLTNFTVNVADGDYEATNWTDSNTTPASNHLNSALVFTVTAQAGYTVTLNELSFVYKPQGNGPEQVGAWTDHSIDVNDGPFGGIDSFLSNFWDTDGDPETAIESYDSGQTFTITGQSVTLAPGESASFYVIGFDAGSTGRKMRIDNVTLISTNGVSAVPEPSSFAMFAGLGAIGFAATRRRRRA